MIKQHVFTQEDLLRCSHGELFGSGNARLPTPSMLMVDRTVRINDVSSKHGKGELVTEPDISPDLWFFACHFEGDPVVSGYLGLDATWQLVSFYLGWQGNPDRGRALDSDEMKFSGQVPSATEKVTYNIHIKRTINHSLVLAIADSTISAGSREIYSAGGPRVGLLTSADSL